MSCLDELDSLQPNYKLWLGRLGGETKIVGLGSAGICLRFPVSLARRFLSLFFCSGFNQRSTRDFVAFFDLDQSDALRAAAGLTNVISLQADQLGLLRNDHDLRLRIDGKYCNNLSGLLGRFHVDDALAAA